MRPFVKGIAGSGKKDRRLSENSALLGALIMRSSRRAGYETTPTESHRSLQGRVFVNFTPAISRAATKALQQEIRGWRVHLKSDKSIEDLSRMFAPVIRGWINYYCRFYPSAFKPVADRLNMALTCWAMRKLKRLRGHKRRSRHWIGRVTQRQPGLIPHWRAGFVTSAGIMGAG
jgi:RNA-directed DNA polymerase